MEAILQQLDREKKETGKSPLTDGEVTAIAINLISAGNLIYNITLYLKGIYTPAGIAYIFKFGLTWSPFTYSMTLDAYHIDSVNTCYD